MTDRLERGTPTLSEQLRHDTRSAHRAAEITFALDIRLADERAYGALLVALHAFYAPVEDAIGAVRGWDGLTPRIDVVRRRRTMRLDEDLATLGIAAPTRGTGGEPEIPVLGSLAAGVGCLYVLEGSALGGRIVARRARAALGASLPVAFFSSAGRDLGTNWRSLQAAIDRFGAGQGAAASGEAVATARHTFAALGDWLELQTPTP